MRRAPAGLTVSPKSGPLAIALLGDSRFFRKMEAFLHGLSMHGIHSCKIEEADYSYESGAEAAYRLLTSAHAPDAILLVTPC